jgi:hypothetical protein
MTGVGSQWRGSRLLPLQKHIALECWLGVGFLKVMAWMPTALLVSRVLRPLVFSSDC